MRIAIIIAAALAASPAAPQVGVGGGVGVGVGTGVAVDTGRTVGTVVDSVDRTQRLTDRTLDSTRFALVTRSQVSTGAEVRDSRGQRIGTVARLDGNSAIVVSGRNAYRVPLSALYRRTSGAARGLVTTIPRAQLTGHASANADAHSAAHAGD